MGFFSGGLQVLQGLTRWLREKKRRKEKRRRKRRLGQGKSSIFDFFKALGEVYEAMAIAGDTATARSPGAGM